MTTSKFRVHQVKFTLSCWTWTWPLTIINMYITHVCKCQSWSINNVRKACDLYRPRSSKLQRRVKTRQSNHKSQPNQTFITMAATECAGRCRKTSAACLHVIEWNSHRFSECSEFERKKLWRWMAVPEKAEMIRGKEFGSYLTRLNQEGWFNFKLPPKCSSFLNLLLIVSSNLS